MKKRLNLLHFCNCKPMNPCSPLNLCCGFKLRILLQSVLPGILQGDKSDSLLYGSVDNGKKICWNEDFHSKVRKRNPEV